MKVNRELQQIIKNSNPYQFETLKSKYEDQGTLIGEFAYLKFEYGSMCHKKTAEDER